MTELKPLAYHHYLMKATNGDLEDLTLLIRHHVIEDNNPMAYDLLEATGDKTYTSGTFKKAAQLVKDICEK